ncbi:hypothetical protein [Saccharothrix lopnurensis]|uniref:Phospholipase D-like protein n=1 Tax=Saccharothrix lopnurensis TaxID=1670621 RepID=A0ABW1P0R3_9PSEU
MTTTRIWIRYQPVPVQVRLGYGTEMSRIESAVLRAVVEFWQGSASDVPLRGVGLSKLVEIFGLGERVTLHLLFDLWTREYITLDLYRNIAAPTQVALDAFSGGGVSGLAGAESKQEDSTVWLDPVSGHLTGRQGHRRATDPDLIVPSYVLFAANADEIRRGDLLRAVNERIAEQVAEERVKNKEGRRTGRQTKVQEVRMASTHQRTEGGSSMLFPVDVTVRRDPVNHEVRVVVAHDSRRTLAQCEKIGDLITEFIRRRPEHKFSRRLTGRIETRLVDPPSLERSIDSLANAAITAKSAPAGTRDTTHEQLVDAVKTIRAQIAAMVSTEAEVELVGSIRDYRSAVGQTIRAAERQVVLVAPAVRYAGLVDLSDDLKAAVQKGVQIILVWGRRSTDAIEAKAKNVIIEITNTATDAGFNASAVLVVGQPALINAGFVLADNHTAVVGGYNCLDRDHGSDTHQLGAVVRATEPGGCEVAYSLLRWTRRAMPDRLTASAVFFQERDFRVVDDDLPTPAEGLVWSDLPEPLPRDTGASDASVQAWAEAWEECAAEAARHVALRKLPSVTLVEDGAHHRTLWDGVREARRQLVVAGSRLTTTAVTDQLIVELTNRVAGGTRTDVVYQFLQRDADATRAALGRVRGANPGGFAVRQADSAAKALVTDDTVVIGSFDYVSHDGFFGGHPGRRPPAEVSVRVSGGDVAARAAELLGARVVRKPKKSTTTPHPRARRSHRLLVALEKCTSRSQRAEVVTEAVSGGRGTALLAALRATQVEDGILALVAAATLREGIDTADPDHRWWAGWLVDRLWEQERFVEAWVLRQALPDGGVPLALAAVAAAAGTTLVGAVVEANALECADGDNRVALIALIVSQLVAWPGGGTPLPGDVAHNLRGSLEVLDSLDPEGKWHELVEAVLAMGARVDEPGVAAVVRELVTEANRDASLAENWDRAEEALNALGSMSFGFEAGLKTQARLLHPEGIFGKLRTIIDARDLDPAAQWLSAPDLVDLPGFLDRTTAEVSVGQKNNVIHSGKRKQYLDRLTQVVTAVEDVVAFQPERHGHQGVFQVEAVRSLADAVVRLWPGLHIDLEKRTSPARHLIAHAMSSMAEIREWGARDQHG